MKKNIQKALSIVSVFTLFTILLLVVLPVPVKAAGTTLITLSPTTGSIGKSTQSINVNLNSSGVDISAINLNIQYNPLIFSVTVEEGTITALHSLYSSSITNEVINIQAGALSYNGSGLLAKLKVKVLNDVTTAQNSDFTIKSDSKVTSPTDSTTNQLASSVLGAVSTFSADPAYTSGLPSTALFDNELPILLAEMAIGIFLVVGLIKITKSKSESDTITNELNKN